jgi:hypothetical protein
LFWSYSWFFSGQEKRREQGMICQKCLQTLEDDQGRNYLFYYGVQTGFGYYTRYPATHVLGTYQILGSDQAFICNACVDAQATRQYVKHCRFAALYIAITTLPISWLFFVAGVNFFLVYGLFLLCAFLVLLGGEWLNRRAKRQHFVHVSGSSQAKYGSEVAVQAKRKAAFTDMVASALKMDKDKAAQVKFTGDLLKEVAMHSDMKQMHVLFTPQEMRRLKHVRT